MSDKKDNHQRVAQQNQFPLILIFHLEGSKNAITIMYFEVFFLRFAKCVIPFLPILDQVSL